MVRKIIIILLILGLSLAVVTKSRVLRPYRSDKILQSVLRDVISQNQLKGFVIFNMAIGKMPEVVESKINDIYRHTTQMTTVASLGRRYQYKIARFIQNTTRFTTWKGQYLVKSNLALRDNIYMIVIIYNYFSSTSIRRQLLYCEKFVARQSVTKILLIFLVHKSYGKYKAMLTTLTRSDNNAEYAYYSGGIYNAIVLEIVINVNCSSEKSRYKIFHYNHSNDLFKSFKYKKGIEMLPSSTRSDLHGRLIKMPRAKPMNLHLYYMTYYPVDLAIKKLNASLRLITDNRKNHGSFDLCPYSFDPKPRIYDAMITPSLLRPSLFMAPSFYDETQQETYGMWLLSLLTICWTIACFWFCSKFFKYDRLTWDPTIVFSMIISVGNPRNPMGTSESMLFFTLIMVGFFFGSDLITNLTTVSIKESVERPMETWEDLQANNITLVHYWVARDNKYAWEHMRNLRHISIQTDLGGNFMKYFKHMLWFKNVSLTSQILIIQSHNVPQRFVVKGEVQIRLTGIIERYTGFLYLMRPNRPWFYSLSYYLSQVFESQLERPPKIRALSNLLYLKTYRCVFDAYSKEMDDKEDNNDNVGSIENYWLIIVVTIPLSMLLLLIETRVIKAFDI